MSNKIQKRLIAYTAITILCGLFSFVYEHFSHQVYSDFMVYLFVIPLLLGVLPQLLYTVQPHLNVSSAWQRTIHSFAIATLTVGSVLQGMLQIYGTTSSFIKVYFVIGLGLLLTSIALILIKYFKQSLKTI